jgi:hypothetical protein
VYIVAHLEANMMANMSEIGAYVDEKYGVRYSVADMRNWLQRQGFSYKKPKGTPAKADAVKQTAFIAEYQGLMQHTPQSEPVLFGEGVHLTMATKRSYGWIRKGQDKCLPTTASRTRVNLFGALDLETMSVCTTTHETIDSMAMKEHFQALRAR